MNNWITTGILSGRQISKMARVISVLIISAALLAVSGCASTGSGTSASLNTLKGTVSIPVEDAYVFVYEGGVSPYGPPYAMSKATGPDGGFEVELPDGEYTIVARKHKSGLPGSPLTPGDQKTEAVAVKVEGGRQFAQSLVLLDKTDEVQNFEPGTKSDTSISGKVIDSEGNPMREFRVHVYTYTQMSERPKYVSAATGPDGDYVVYLPKGGTYYLAARDHFGGPPKIGDYYGRYDEGTIDPSGVILRTGQSLEHVNITVHKVW